MKGNNQVNLSVIIINTNNINYTDLCIKSFIDNTLEFSDKELVIVNNGCSEDSYDLLKKYAKLDKVTIKAIEVNEKKSLAYCINAGVINSSGKWILYVNEDNIFPTDWETTYYSKKKKGYLISPNLIEPGKYIKVAKGFNEKDFGLDYKTFDYNGFLDYEKGIRSNKVMKASGTPHLMLKTDFMIVGGYDLVYRGVAMSDVDFYFKLRLNGVKMERYYSCGFYHFSGKSSRLSGESKTQTKEYTEEEKVNLTYFHNKWHTSPFSDINGMWWTLPVLTNGIDFKRFSLTGDKYVLNQLKKFSNFMKNTPYFDTRTECDIMFNYSMSKKPKKIVELGIGNGFSSVALLLCANASNAKLISIDIEGSTNAKELVKHYVGDTNNWISYTGNDLDIADEYKDVLKGIDILFIDTNHEKEHTMKELSKFSKLVNDGGVIFLHDSKSYEGVKHSVEEFLVKNQNWTFRQFDTQHGLVHLTKRRN